jgi:hypothetical protein
MKLAWLGSAALALGVSAIAPSLTQAAPWRGDRDDVRYREDARFRDRYDHRDRDYRDYRVSDRADDCRDFDVNVSLRDVPRAVLATADCERHGNRIESVQYVRRDGKLFYRVRLDDPSPRDRDVNLRIQPGGRLLSIQEAEQCDPGFFHGVYRR